MIKIIKDLWAKWGLKAGSSIVDQGVFSLANFIFNVLLIRWMVPAEYGSFAVIFSFLLFFAGFHQAIILEPMSVIGPAHFQKKLHVYVGASLWIHFILTFAISFLLVAVFLLLLLIRNIAVMPILALALAMPLILFFWLFRQACYLKMAPAIALKASILYSVLLALGLLFLYKQNLLSSFSALLLMALASLGAGLFSWNNLGIENDKLTWRIIREDFNEIVIKNWNYARWGMGCVFFSWLSSVFYLPLVGFFAGLSAAGVLRAMQNLTMPLQRALSALGLLLLPWLSSQRSLKGDNYLKSFSLKLIAVNVFIALPYLLILLVFSKSIVGGLYKHGYYSNFVWLLAILAAGALVESLAQVFYICLKAMEKLFAIFMAQAFAVLFTFLAGLYLIKKYALAGAGISIVVSSLLMGGVAVFYYFKYLNLARHKEVMG